MKKSLFAIAAVGFLSLVMGTPSAQAAILTLTGGDVAANETVAFTPRAIPVYAYKMHTTAGDGNTLLQSTNFLPFPTLSPPAGFTLTNKSGNADGVAVNFGGGPTPNSSQDTALKVILGHEVFSNNGIAGPTQFNGPMVLTIPGLTTGTIYQVDLFVYSSSAVRPATYDINGITDSFLGSTTTATDIRENVAAVGGQIVVTVTGTANNGAFLNAFVVSVPEPASFGLLGVGTMMLARRRRHA